MDSTSNPSHDNLNFRPRLPRAFTDLSPSTTRNTLPSSSSSFRKYHLDFLHNHHHHAHKRHDEKGSSANISPTTASGPSSRPAGLQSRPTALRIATLAPDKGKRPSVQESTIDSPASRRGEMKVVERKVVVRPVDVVRERERGALRDEELRDSLNTLSDLAHNSTRHLDGLYYSLLEKVQTLRSMMTSLQELSTASDKLHRNFKDEVRRLEEDITGQVDEFKGFDEQQERIEALEKRIVAGQGKAKGLSERLEECRRKAEEWEIREKEWQARTSKSLNWGSGVLVAALLGLISFLIIRRVTQPTVQSHLDLDALRKILQNSSLPSFAMDDLAQLLSAHLTSASGTTSSLPTVAPSDARLASFDEL